MNAKAVVPVLLVVAAAATFWAFRHREAEGLVLSGTIEARDVEVGSLTGGRVAAVHADEGDTVKKGQPLVTFETDMVDAQVRQQEAQVAGAEAALARALNGPRVEERATAQAQYDEAERERRRLHALLEEGIIPRAQYDEAATKARVAQEALRQLERGNRPEDIASARAALERASKKTYAAAIVDLRMPLINGLGFLYRLRAQEQYHDTPVAIVTGDYGLDDAIARELDELGAELRFKPLWFEDLIDLAHSLLASNRGSHPRPLAQMH